MTYQRDQQKQMVISSSIAAPSTTEPCANNPVHCFTPVFDYLYNCNQVLVVSSYIFGFVDYNVKCIHFTYLDIIARPLYEFRFRNKNRDLVSIKKNLFLRIS